MLPVGASSRTGGQADRRPATTPALTGTGDKGATPIVLAVGAEKMFSADKVRSSSAFDGAWDIADTEEGKRRLLEMGHGIEPPPGTV